MNTSCALHTISSGLEHWETKLHTAAKSRLIFKCFVAFIHCRHRGTLSNTSFTAFFHFPGGDICVETWIAPFFFSEMDPLDAVLLRLVQVTWPHLIKGFVSRASPWLLSIAVFSIGLPILLDLLDRAGDSKSRDWIETPRVLDLVAIPGRTEPESIPEGSALLCVEFWTIFFSVSGCGVFWGTTAAAASQTSIQPQATLLRRLTPGLSCSSSPQNLWLLWRVQASTALDLRSPKAVPLFGVLDWLAFGRRLRLGVTPPLDNGTKSGWMLSKHSLWLTVLRLLEDWGQVIDKDNLSSGPPWVDDLNVAETGVTGRRPAEQFRLRYS